MAESQFPEIPFIRSWRILAPTGECKVPSGFECCFCGKHIEETGSDPVGLTVTLANIEANLKACTAMADASKAILGPEFLL
jgi:hypothetical protein